MLRVKEFVIPLQKAEGNGFLDFAYGYARNDMWMDDKLKFAILPRGAFLSTLRFLYIYPTEMKE